MRRNINLMCVFVSVLCMSGCEEDVVRPFDSNMPFSLYGVLSPDLDTQSVRVYPLNFSPQALLPESLEVDVHSTHLETAERHLWADSVIVEADGERAFVYWAPFRPEFGETYRVDAVRRSDGAVSFATVDIPPQVDIRLDESDAPLLDVFVEGKGIRMSEPEAVYTLGSRIVVSYAGQEQPTGDGWKVTFNMIMDYDHIRMYVYGGGFCSPPYRLSKLELYALIGSEIWDPPGGVFDPNFVSHARTISNVENGYGFVGGGYRLSASLQPSKEAVESACFEYGL